MNSGEKNMESNLNVLVVDDEQIVLDSVARHLRHDAFEVHKALSAMAALKIMEREPIHIVLADLMMPEMDGLELMQAVRKQYPNVPVIMITGYATINTALQAMQLGAFDYVAKPFTKAELRGVVARAASLQGAAEGESAGTATDGGGKAGESGKSADAFKGIGGHTWMMREEDGNVLIGVERPFLHMLGRIQTVDLPAKGDELRQGSVCFQIFTADLSSHVLWSPVSGTVVEVNEEVLTDPEGTLNDPYGDGWLLRIRPSNFDNDIKVLGL
jgi:CheY-like chemotaxis protein/glycine cleavage system H lipoate-binding protein